MENFLQPSSVLQSLRSEVPSLLFLAGCHWGHSESAIHTTVALGTEHLIPPQLCKNSGMRWELCYVSLNLQGVVWIYRREDHQATVTIVQHQLLGAGDPSVFFLCAVSMFLWPVSHSLFCPIHPNLPFHTYLLPCWALGV